MGAATDECPPCITSAATAMVGLVEGENPTNHALLLNFALCADFCNPMLTTCAVPVFPEISMPGHRAPAPVPPPSFTTPHIPFKRISSVVFFKGKRRSVFSGKLTFRG